MGRRIVGLHDTLTRILRAYGRAVAAMWLVGTEPPVQAVRLRGGS